jgi:hypothetical protein
MFGKNRFIIFPVDEKCRNECIFDVFYWVQILDAEVVLNIGGNNFYLIVDLMKESAVPLKSDNFPTCLSANSLESVSILEKGESRTRHPI